MRKAIQLIAVFCFALQASAAEHTLKLVSLANTQDEDYAGAVAFKDYVESESQGEIEVILFPNGQLCGNSVECLLALEAGVMDVYISTLSGLANFFPEIQVLDLPYMFDSDEAVETLYAGRAG